MPDHPERVTRVRPLVHTDLVKLAFDAGWREAMEHQEKPVGDDAGELEVSFLEFLEAEFEVPGFDTLVEQAKREVVPAPTPGEVMPRLTIEEAQALQVRASGAQTFERLPNYSALLDLGAAKLRAALDQEDGDG